MSVVSACHWSLRAAREETLTLCRKSPRSLGRGAAGRPASGLRRVRAPRKLVADTPGGGYLELGETTVQIASLSASAAACKRAPTSASSRAARSGSAACAR